nr:malto-oligosyltrehalose trehalohydrolase [Geminicoccaceae bacterium]
MTDQATHRFGAWPVEGGVRFALWAPSRPAVDLLLGHEEQPLRMEAAADGWHRLTVGGAAAGDRYRFRLDDGRCVPDPASRAQCSGVHGPSVVVDPAAYSWRHRDWRGRPWHEAVLYELHVGTFSPAGTFDGVRGKLRHLADLGITAVELMPLGHFPGERGWGYDGALLFAPHGTYGSPESLKALVDEAHGHGLSMLLDVVYNHFGPEGNYLGSYSPFFRHDLKTAWGDAIDFRQRPVRDFFIQNALQWLEEYRFDGLRLDAVHAIHDDSSPHFLDELAETVHRRFDGRRHVHLVLENERNEVRRLGPRRCTAQWNDDWHHCAHVLLMGERDGYYAAFADRPMQRLARAATQGFVYQGEPSPIDDGRARGEPSAGLPPTAFVDFLQNHDQIGNRALGERLAGLCAPEALDAFTALLLLSPHVPMLFMGEEWGAATPFLFFTDFHDGLATAVREGRRREFAIFPAFADPEDRAAIPDPNAPSTFARSRLDWTGAETPQGSRRRELVRRLLEVRRHAIVPLLPLIGGHAGEARRIGGHGLDAR